MLKLPPAARHRSPAALSGLITTPERAHHISNDILEAAAQEFADATAQPPFLYELEPERARKVLDDIQATPVSKPDIAREVDHGPGRGG